MALCTTGHISPCSQLPIVQLLSLPLLSAQLAPADDSPPLSPLTSGHTSEDVSLRGRGQWSAAHHQPRLRRDHDDGRVSGSLVSLGWAREGHFREGVYSQCSSGCGGGPGQSAETRVPAWLRSDEIQRDGADHSNLQ